MKKKIVPPLKKANNSDASKKIVETIYLNDKEKVHTKGGLREQIKSILGKDSMLLDQYYKAITEIYKDKIIHLKNVIQSSRIPEKRNKLIKKANKAGRKEINDIMLNLYSFNLRDRYLYSLRILFKGKEFWISVFLMVTIIALVLPWVLWYTKPIPPIQ